MIKGPIKKNQRMRPPGMQRRSAAAGMTSTAPFSGLAKPRFLRELVVIPLEDAIVVDGAGHLQVLQGKATRSLVPELIQLMDGSRTPKQIEESLSHVPAEYVYAAMSLMMRCGLIEDVAVAPALGPAPNEETLAFFRRYVAATNANRSGQAAYEKLQAAEVVIATDAATPGVEVLRSALVMTGIGRVTCIESASLAQSQMILTAGSQTIVVSLMAEDEDPETYARLDDWCSKERVCWLRVVVRPGRNYADIGPLFHREQHPCYRCFHAVHGSDSSVAGGNALSAADISFWSSMVATELIYLINRIGPLLTGRDFRRYDLQTWKAQQLRWFRIPGCPHCLPLQEHGASNAASGSSVSVPTGFVFEEYVGLTSRAFSVPKGSPEQARMIAALSHQVKRLPHSPKLFLNRDMPKLECGTLDALQTAGSAQRKTFTAEDLGAVLMMTAGIRVFAGQKTQVKRWAATAGNMDLWNYLWQRAMLKVCHQGSIFTKHRSILLQLFNGTAATLASKN